jgi:3-phenylpropionate/trans-cinnamate dioxygenase ferredoxin reductase subunit
LPLDRIVVVGGSLAGLRAVEALRRRGFSGRIVWIGAEASRPYDRPPLSKQILRGEWQPDRVLLKANYDALEVDLRLGTRARALDARAREVVLDGGERVPYDGLVTATGASPRALPMASPLSGVHTLRTVEDALAIRRTLERAPRVAVIGAGFIGLEVAASVRALGLSATVVEAARVPLGTVLGDAVGEHVANVHRDHGVVLRTGVGVAGFVGDGHVEGIRLEDGSTVPADLVVVGIGVVPETRWLEGSGVALEGGVLCDARSGTNVPGVVACGDVARFDNPLFGERMRVEHWSNAVEQANAAAARLLDGEGAPEFAPVPYFWSDQYDLKIQFAGRVAATDEFRVLEGSFETKDLVALYGRAGRLRGVLAVNKPAALVRYRRAIADGAPF